MAYFPINSLESKVIPLIAESQLFGERFNFFMSYFIKAIVGQFAFYLSFKLSL
jgi:hypothetical protein